MSLTLLNPSFWDFVRSGTINPEIDGQLYDDPKSLTLKDFAKTTIHTPEQNFNQWSDFKETFSKTMKDVSPQIEISDCKIHSPTHQITVEFKDLTTYHTLAESYYLNFCRIKNATGIIGLIAAINAFFMAMKPNLMPPFLNKFFYGKVVVSGILLGTSTWLLSRQSIIKNIWTRSTQLPQQTKDTMKQYYDELVGARRWYFYTYVGETYNNDPQASQPTILPKNAFTANEWEILQLHRGTLKACDEIEDRWKLYLKISSQNKLTTHEGREIKRCLCLIINDKKTLEFYGACRNKLQKEQPEKTAEFGSKVGRAFQQDIYELGHAYFAEEDQRAVLKIIEKYLNQSMSDNSKLYNIPDKHIQAYIKKFERKIKEKMQELVQELVQDEEDTWEEFIEQYKFNNSKYEL